MTTLSVVIPAYNEENGIAEIASRVLAMGNDLLSVGVNQIELLVVDDGSSDRTAEIAADIPGVQLIQHPVNRGYGAALKTGFSQASGELIGFLDADGTYPPECFPDLCAVALSDIDLVIGSRMAGANSQMPVTRRAGNMFFARLLTLVSSQQVSDSASGMRVFKRSVLERLYPLPDGLNLTPVMSTRAVHKGIRMAEIPIPYEERVGNSKLSVVHDGSLFLQSMLWTALQYNPVRILGLVGLTGIALGLLALAALIVARLSGLTTLGPWGVALLYTGAVAGMVGVNIFLLGVVFNYLVSLFHQRPVRQGLFGRPLLKTPLEQHFGWLGLVTLAAGVMIATVLLVLGINGWGVDRLWLYGLGGAMFVLLGIQLIIYWIILRVLDELVAQQMARDLESNQPAEIALETSS